MRELFLVSSDSTESSLVLRTEGGEEFFLAVTEELRELLSPTADVIAAADSAAAQPQQQPSKGAGVAAPASQRRQAATTAITQPHSLPTQQRAATEPIPLRPAEIQNRIRAGASAADLAAELGVPESRIEPFAYPVMLERERVADVAKQAHPVREDGPAKLTLWEILATSFAARGHSLSESTWDAYRHQGEPWIVRITWKAGLSQNEAEWTFRQSMSTPATVEARNSVAADLTDPDFVQPVRSLTSIGRGERYEEAFDGQGPSSVTDIADFTTPTAPRPEAAEDSADSGEEKASANESASSQEPAQADGSAGEEKDNFLQNPPAERKPSKRRRKAVTPHWEDVLLGVRSNTKRPRD
ncbi:septation protein SepH [Corynebacterium flavescens]|uniref:septation protein SepH n=1 Tax=Corynebacterium flavescens TaxID=28028 RepID=UPI00289BD2A6|nr:septation protein SepH [Corynebacterium flavescens]